MNLTGSQFQICHLPEAEVLISPSLTINKFDDLTKINGLIKIDSAKIEIKTLPKSAVAPSEDEFIISDDQAPPKIVDPAYLNTQLSLDFGDNTHFSGFGLETRLTGKLQYIVQEDKQSVQGQATMHDASYRSYGQDLVIRKGKFLFNGSADNPWLNIEAIRKSIDNDVTAVLNVTGPLKSPETRVYTEPPLSESEALSYLVTGDSLKGASKSEGSAVANAAFNYGAGQLYWLGDQLGIDEFEFKQSKKIKNSAVKLGHYLNPDLYIGITMGLFSNKYAASIKYRLTENFSIDTRAGESQRIDLKYHIKTD
jgi:translocation and assembly module TamB